MIRTKEIISSSYYGNSFILIDESYGILDEVQCKEEFIGSWALATELFNWYDWNLGIGEDNGTKVNMRYPKIGYHISSKYEVLSSAKRVDKVLTLLSSHFGKTSPIVWVSPKKHSGIVISINRDLVRNAYGLSMVLSLIRSSAQTIFEFKTLKEFFLNVQKLDIKDAKYFRRTKLSGTLKYYLEGKLPCQNRRGYSDFRYFPENQNIENYVHDGIYFYRRNKKYKKVTDKMIKDEALGQAYV